jgi:hypothetical protein
VGMHVPNNVVSFGISHDLLIYCPSLCGSGFTSVSHRHQVVLPLSFLLVFRITADMILSLDPPSPASDPLHSLSGHCRTPSGQTLREAEFTQWPLNVSVLEGSVRFVNMDDAFLETSPCRSPPARRRWHF